MGVDTWLSGRHVARMRTLLVAVLLAACGDNLPAQSTGEYVVEMCGEAPLAPGVVAAFDGEIVTMRRQVFDDLEAYRETVAVWRDCVTHLP